jgi:hypothetical protein
VRAATLSSSDTREWFCFVFIPIIPPKKFRILEWRADGVRSIRR